MRQIQLLSLAKVSGFIALTSCFIPVNASATSSIPEINPTPTTLTQSKTPIILASRYDSQLLELTNAERRKAGLPPLRLSPQLGQAAQSHAEDMVRNNYFNHTGANGSQPSDRARAAGYSGSYIGENIAAGKANPADTIRQWMNSPGHRANILRREYTEIGFGYVNASSTQYRHFWVQVFGTPSGGSSSGSQIQNSSPSDTSNPPRRIFPRRFPQRSSNNLPPTSSNPPRLLG